MMLRHPIGIKTRIVVFYLLATLLVVGIMGAALFYSASDIISEEVINTIAVSGKAVI